MAYTTPFLYPTVPVVGATEQTTTGQPPPLLAEWEAHVMADECPAVVTMHRANVRALLRYVRRLERDAKERT